MIYKSYVLDSLETVFYDSDIKEDNLKYTKMMSNEAFSFQLALRADKVEDNIWVSTREVWVEIESELKEKILVYTVENVPSLRIGYAESDDWFLRKEPGVYPDCLTERGSKMFTLPAGYWKSVWININEDLSDIEPKKYPITIKIMNRSYDGKEITEIVNRTVEIEVLDAKLPKQDIITTNWVHYDCMAKLSNTEILSEEFWTVMKNYIRLAAKNGQNMLLVPAFTPPLDTPVGEERDTVQLIKVKKENDKYTFDFSILDRFLKDALECGIEYFEHSHLFTQWGAEHAPKIIVNENGEDKKMFGWDMDAHGDEYRGFLHEYLTALKEFIREKGYEKRFFFHISDEPADVHVESYKKTSEFMKKEIEGFPSGDALSEFKFYEDGIVDIPIAATDHCEHFLGKANPLWVYYTGGQSRENLSNRLIGMPQERGRVLGVQLYYHDIKGFLQWGYNAHHNRLSRKIIDPKISADMGNDFVGGTSYIVYPADKTAEASVRLLTFRDQMQDTRAMKLLEDLTDRENVCEIIKKHIPDIGFKCRVTAKQLLDLRNEINDKIMELI